MPLPMPSLMCQSSCGENAYWGHDRSMTKRKSALATVSPGDSKPPFAANRGLYSLAAPSCPFVMRAADPSPPPLGAKTCHLDQSIFTGGNRFLPVAHLRVLYHTTATAVIPPETYADAGIRAFRAKCGCFQD